MEVTESHVLYKFVLRENFNSGSQSAVSDRSILGTH